MRKQVLMGLAVILIVGCSHNKITPPSPIVKKQKKEIVVDKSKVVVDKSKNEKPKKTIIDLDKEIKKDGLKGGAFETIRGLIPMGHNDEVSFKGEKLFIATDIKLYINGKLKSTIKSVKDMFTIKGSEVNDGDRVVIKNRFNVELMDKKVVKK